MMTTTQQVPDIGHMQRNATGLNVLTLQHRNMLYYVIYKTNITWNKMALNKITYTGYFI